MSANETCQAVITGDTLGQPQPWTTAAGSHHETMQVDGLYNRWGDEIWAYIRSMCGNDSDADDVFQQVFLKAHRGLPTFCGSDAQARAWLFTIAINAVRDHHRRQRHHQDMSHAADQTAPGHGPLATMAGQELALRIGQAVATLSPKLREVWVLRGERQLPFQDIADLLGEPRKRIMGRMYLALEQIRNAIAGSSDHD